jgi:large subunit ribosomal protein L9
MQVILQEDYAGLGFVGDLVKVKPGFARNFLLPKKIALAANTQNIELLEHRKRILEVKKAARKKDAEMLKTKLEAISIVTQHASDGEKLFGSVTTSELQVQLAEQGVEIDRKLIKLEAPIRSIGEHTLIIKLHQEVTAKVIVKVEATAESLAKASTKKEKAAKAEKVEKVEDVQEAPAEESAPVTEESDA